MCYRFQYHRQHAKGARGHGKESGHLQSATFVLQPSLIPKTVYLLLTSGSLVVKDEFLK